MCPTKPRCAIRRSSPWIRSLSVRARSNDSLLKLEYQADGGPQTDTLEYTHTALRNEILAELYRMSRGRLRRRVEKASLLSTIGAPLGLAIFIFILTVVCFMGVMGVMSTASSELTGQLNQTQVDILWFLIKHGQTVVIAIGGLAFLAALAWLTWSLLKPTKVVILKPKGQVCPTLPRKREGKTAKMICGVAPRRSIIVCKCSGEGKF